jgi:N-dimethylarginine dimethylaminohydrolase
MCPPTHYGIQYEINTWMHVDKDVDPTLARRQWDMLYRLLADAGVTIERIEQIPGQPDMVFTANAGLVQDDIFVPSRFRHPERAGEEPNYTAWFYSRGYAVRPLPKRITGSHEGEGDTLTYGELLIAGYGLRTDLAAQEAVARVLDHPMVPLGLVDPRWYHLDTCFLPLSDNLFAYVPQAFDALAQRTLEMLPGEKIVIDEADALRFAANAVVVGRDVVLPSGCENFEADLAAYGYRPHPVPMSEFIKAGGACKCLALVLG